jgi:hypothetical protein
MDYSGRKEDKEGLWGKKNPGLGMAEEQVTIEENSMTQTTRALIAEVEKIGDIGGTADPLEIILIVGPSFFAEMPGG